MWIGSDKRGITIKINGVNKSGVRVIEYKKGNEKLESIMISKNVRFIRPGAFNDCINLKKVIFEDGADAIIHIIDDYAFCNCVNLKEIIIPRSVEFIGALAFYNCKSLKRIIIPGSVYQLNSHTFGLCDNLEEVILDEGLECLNLLAFSSCHKLKKVIIPSSVKEVSTELINYGGKSYTADIHSTEFYSREINTRFISDINWHSDKSEPELIDELCSKYPYIKQQLLELVKVKFKIGEYADKDLNFDDEYNSFINYCKNNLFVSLQKHNSTSQKNIDNSTNNQAKKLVPWYASHIPGFIIGEYIEDNSSESIKNLEEGPKHNLISNVIDEKYKLDKKGNVWVKGENGQDDDIMPKSFVYEHSEELRKIEEKLHAEYIVQQQKEKRKKEADISVAHYLGTRISDIEITNGVLSSNANESHLIGHKKTQEQLESERIQLLNILKTKVMKHEISLSEASKLSKDISIVYAFYIPSEEVSNNNRIHK